MNSRYRLLILRVSSSNWKGQNMPGIRQFGSKITDPPRYSATKAEMKKEVQRNYRKMALYFDTHNWLFIYRN